MFRKKFQIWLWRLKQYQRLLLDKNRGVQISYEMFKLLSDTQLDYHLLGKVRVNPDQVCKKYGLSAEETQIIKDGGENLVKLLVALQDRFMVCDKDVVSEKFVELQKLAHKVTEPARNSISTEHTVTKPTPDIYIIGFGIRSVGQTTQEVEQILSFCSTALTANVDFGVISYLKARVPHVINLTVEYGGDIDRYLTYQRMAAKVVDKALQKPPVAFIVYGHPGCLVFSTKLINLMANELNLKVETIVGISSIDTAMIDTGVDPWSKGMQIYEANDLVLRSVPIVNTVPLLLLQADFFNIDTFLASSKPTSVYSPLVDYLCRFYPEDHEIYSVFSSIHPLVNSIKNKIVLKEFGEFLAGRFTAGTIYIPPIGNQASR